VVGVSFCATSAFSGADQNAAVLPEITGWCWRQGTSMMTYVKLAFGQLRWLSSMDCIGEWTVFCLRVWCTWLSKCSVAKVS
jgi:hypothetical protein